MNALFLPTSLPLTCSSFLSATLWVKLLPWPMLHPTKGRGSASSQFLFSAETSVSGSAGYSWGFSLLQEPLTLRRGQTVQAPRVTEWWLGGPIVGSLPAASAALIPRLVP